MNKLSYKIDKEQKDPYNDNFRVVIDDKDTDYYFDVAALEISNSEEGVFPMLVCGCGYMGCMGKYVRVKLTPTEVIWEKFYDSYADDNSSEEDELKEVELTKTWNEGVKEFIIKPPLKFDRKEYASLIKNLLSELPKYEKALYTYKDCIESYKKGDRFRM